MSNTSTTHDVQRYDATVDPTITLPFTRERLAIAGTKLEVYLPDERTPHSQVTLWDAKLGAVDGYVDNLDGNVCTTLKFKVNGQTVDISLWGVTLDSLAVAVDAAQREAAGEPAA